MNMTIPSVRLDWMGPLSLSDGRFPERFSRYSIPAVYLIYMEYWTKTACYVGRAENFVEEVRSHLSATLGLTYWLRDAKGDWIYEPKTGVAFLKELADLEDNQALARAEIRRLTWFFAKVERDLLPDVEAILIRHLKARAQTGTRLEGQPMECDNGDADAYAPRRLIVENHGRHVPREVFGATIPLSGEPG